ncbi:hypothetical protein ACFL2Q_05110 [Thermodesulfobacteriota bacterium]
MLLKKVIYSGMHAGDFLSVAEMKTLQPEIERLSSAETDNEEEAHFIRDFERKMRELTKCVLQVKKPLVF